MMNRDSPIRHAQFTKTEFAALQELRAQYHARPQSFTHRELAHLRFLRWLVHQPVWSHMPCETVCALAEQLRGSNEPALDERLCRLKAACDAGYYRTEPSVCEQTPLPWQSKTCDNCPFWSISICRVFTKHRWSSTHTCMYFERG